MSRNKLTTRHKLLASAISLSFFSLPSAYAVTSVVIDGEEQNVYINTEENTDKQFTITNGSSLTVSGVTAGADTYPATTHTITNASLLLQNGATFNGALTSNNGQIGIYNSAYNGSIRAAAGAGVGDIIINGSHIQGHINSGTGNDGRLILIKDSTLDSGNMTTLTNSSGQMMVMDSTLVSNKFTTLIAQNAESLLLQNVDIITGGLAADVVGAIGLSVSNTPDVVIKNSNINSAGTAVHAINTQLSTTHSPDTLTITDSILNSHYSAALEAKNFNVNISNTRLTTKNDGQGYTCFSHSCGALNIQGGKVQLHNGSRIDSQNTGVAISGDTATELMVVNSKIYSDEAVFNVDGAKDVVITLANTGLILASPQPSLLSQQNILLEATNNSNVDLALQNIHAQGDIIADDTSSVTVLLSSQARLKGQISGVSGLEISRDAIWFQTGDNHVGNLTLTGGVVSMASPAAGSYHTLSTESLLGAGVFAMNTNLQNMQGDLLKVNGEATGVFGLRIANSGSEPTNANDRLNVVQTGGGTALFMVEGGKVDAGVWQYELMKDGNNWYLGTGTQPPHENDNENGNNGETGSQPSGPTTSPSTDAILNMASAPAYIFNNELQNLRQRKGDIAQIPQRNGGVWARYLNNTSHINSSLSAAYNLGQNGIEVGGDKAVSLTNGQLLLGGFTSYTDNKIHNARGGESHIASYSIGLYGSWFNPGGLYVDAAIKTNHFSNTLNTLMSDRTIVNASYSQTGLGGALEAGWHQSLSNNFWLEPFARISTFQAGDKKISLNNGMKANIGNIRSLQGETGIHAGKKLTAGKVVLNPWLKASVIQEFEKDNAVSINDKWTFNNNVSGTTGRYGAGIDIALTKETSVFADVSYQQGRHSESPVNASLGIRAGF
ncbi:autotransporter outer membrane beta-barrel domain-containing protein [Erwinia typographi]|uniref:autotransporter outer membrane beta-barrel domain-containing protein n=1 Tax=Erwinia typographi TaxID=371042 RepID=UPI000690CFB2|nr:autotransporter outer membrane beta-barrel domain-containing protein [Erwinia typographi]